MTSQRAVAVTEIGGVGRGDRRSRFLSIRAGLTGIAVLQCQGVARFGQRHGNDSGELGQGGRNIAGTEDAQELQVIEPRVADDDAPVGVAA